MQAVLSIADFARATQVSAKALRHYHHVGLLEPARTDPDTGYRYYAPEQITAARLIRRFRELDMLLGEIRTVVTTADIALRAEMIGRHLQRLEVGLQRTQDAIVALRGILDGSYGRLGDHVARSAFGLDEPIREYYQVGPPAPPAQWITEICWPVLALST
jgi:DNA-binding transcriptional MerR regulator